MAETINHKRGDTFELNCSVPLAFGQTLTATNCQARRNGGLIQEFTITVLTPTATEYLYSITATAAQTALWKIGTLRLDIQYTVGAKVASTETFFIDVIEDETR